MSLSCSFLETNSLESKGNTNAKPSVKESRVRSAYNLPGVAIKMTNSGEELERPAPLALTQRQQSVLRALEEVEGTRYRMSLYYSGALYALDNPYNPDRISQAAHSLREILDKLPRVVPRSELPKGYDIPGKRRELVRRIAKDRERYTEGWVGEIDSDLAATIEDVSLLLDYESQPTRRENMRVVLEYFDPLTGRFEGQISGRRLQGVYELQKELEGFAHHRGADDDRELRNSIYKLEELILHVLAPTTAEDQEEILSILGGSV